MGGPRHREGGVEDQAASLGFGLFPVPDNIFAVSDDADPTKIVKLELTNLTPATTRTVTVPDANFTIAGLEIANVFTADQEIAKANAQLTIDASSGNAILAFQRANSDAGYIESLAAGTLTISAAGASGYLDFLINSTQRMNLDKSGLFLTPDATYQDTFKVNHSDGTARLQFGVHPGATGYGACWPGAITPDGNNYLFAGNGTSETLFNVPSGGTIKGLVASGAVFQATATAFGPGSDGGQALGGASNRWDTIYGRTAILKPGSNVGDVLEIQDSSGNARLQFGMQSDNSTFGAIYGPDTPNGGVNHILKRGLDASDGMTYLNGTTGVTMQDGGNAVATFDKDTTTFPGLWLAGPTLGSGTYFVIHLNGAAGYGPVLNSPASQALGFSVNNNVEWALTASALYPATDNADDIGTSSLRPRDGYLSRNLFLKGTSVGTNGDGVFVVGSGTAPATSPADAWQAYSADWNGAGTATFHMRNEEGHIIKLFKGAALTASDSTLGNAVTRIGEIEARLQALGLLN